jgi:manganese transport protein
MLITAFVSFGLLPVQLVGIVLLMASAVCFLLELKHPGLGLPTLGGVVFLVLGALWLYSSSVPSAEVSPWLIVLVAAGLVVFFGFVVRGVMEAHQTLGPLLGPISATVFAVALLCSGISSSTVGTMAGQSILEGFLEVRFSIFLRRLLTLIPAIVVIAIGLDPLKILILSQAALSFTLPFALIPLLILTNNPAVMDRFTWSPSSSRASA